MNLQEYVIEQLRIRCHSQGMGFEDTRALVDSFNRAWEDAHPRTRGSEWATPNHETRFLALPGTFSQAEQEVLYRFNLRVQYPQRVYCPTMWEHLLDSV